MPAAPETASVSLPENAYKPLAPGETYRPVVPAAEAPPELTGRSIGWGVLLCVIFTVASAYSGLKVGQVMEAGKWVDVTRADIPQGRLYSWWSYRSPDWDSADKGRRLDHIWATPDIAGAAHGSRILRPVRGWEQPSDHVPVFATFDL